MPAMPSSLPSAAKPAPSPTVLNFFEAHPDVREVECLFADVTGFPRGKVIPAAKFLAGESLRICQAIPMQAVTGEYSYDPIFPDADPDIALVPDLGTLRSAPWASRPRAVCIHDGRELDGTPCGFVPRCVLQRVLSQYHAQGLTPVVAPEIEFYLFSPHSDPTRVFEAPSLPGGRREVGQSAFSLDVRQALSPFWDALNDACTSLGLRTDTWIHEVGPSQFEINLQHGDALAVADQAFLFKHCVRELALAHGLNAVFMAKPLAGAPGSSMHLHQSVLDTQGRNVFSLPDGTDSPALRHYIAGLQALGPELMALWAPNINSYRRFLRGSQAPIQMSWGADNRTTALRIPNSTAVARRVENRVPGADANPYLAIAASLAAGLWGLNQGQQPDEPLTGNGYDSAHSLPRDFAESLHLLECSAQVQQALGADFVQGYCAVKRLELAHYAQEISAWERRYLAPQV
ncbi:MAG: glutamine synthetase family protein [Rhodoferax sp.]